MSSRFNSTFLAALSVRVALAAGFLSAVADRFGLWGAAGTPGVAWGGFASFLAYTGKLLWFLPAGLVPIAGWGATVAEVALAVALLVGFRLRVTAFATGILLLSFALTMTVALGPEPALSYSVWSAAAAAFLLAALSPRHTAKQVTRNQMNSGRESLPVAQTSKSAVSRVSKPADVLFFPSPC